MNRLRVLVGIFIRSSTTPMRVAGLLLLGVLAIGLAVVVRTAPDAASDAPANLVDALGLTLMVPVAALLVATATLGQLRDDRSLVYVWLRPISRFSIAISAWIASVLVTLPTVVIPLTAAAGISGGDADLIWATALASSLGVAAYCGIFVALGTLTKHAAIWGLGYILVWEGVLAAIGSGINRLALRNYTRSIVESVGGADLDLADASSAVAIIVLAAVTAVAVVITTQRLKRSEVD
jgi:ABC-2 type transport system permease protein